MNFGSLAAMINNKIWDAATAETAAAKKISRNDIMDAHFRYRKIIKEYESDWPMCQCAMAGRDPL